MLQSFLTKPAVQHAVCCGGNRPCTRACIHAACADAQTGPPIAHTSSSSNGPVLIAMDAAAVTDHAYAPFSEDSETPQETPQAVGSLRGSSSSPRQASRAFSQHLRMRSDSQDWKRSSSQDKPRTGNAEKPRSAHPVKLRSSHSDKPRNNSRGRLKGGALSPQLQDLVV